MSERYTNLFVVPIAASLGIEPRLSELRFDLYSLSMDQGLKYQKRDNRVVLADFVVQRPPTKFDFQKIEAAKRTIKSVSFPTNTSTREAPNTIEMLFQHAKSNADSLLHSP